MANKKKLYFRIFLTFIIGAFIFLYYSTSVVAGATVPDSADSPARKAELVPLFWTVVFVGGSIALTLSYVSWRKYKAEKKQQAKKDKSVD